MCISVLTITPWPTVKQGNTFAISGRLIDAVTLQPIPGGHIAFKSAFISILPPSARSMNIPSEITDSVGNFKATVSAANEEGAITILALFNGTKSFYASASLPTGLGVSK